MKSRPYLEIRCRLGAHLEEELLALLNDHPVLGCAIEEEQGVLSAAVYVAPEMRGEAASVAAALGGLGAESVEIVELEDRDWQAEYRRQVAPFTVGDTWWIDPHPDRPSAAPPDRRRIAVEPRTAFGSGSHQSTQLVLLELETLSVDGATVLDIGTGSGILATAAKKLGARRVVALDCDLVAVGVARDTSLRQDSPTSIELVIGTVEACGEVLFDRILCNMLSSEMLPMLPALARLMDRDGRAVLSGFLDCERKSLTSAIAAAGLRLEGERRLDGWMAFRVRHD